MSNTRILSTTEVLELIFKDPKVRYELLEFLNLDKEIEDIINIYPKKVSAGKDSGKVKYFIKSFKNFYSGKEEIQVYSEGKSNPEEIVRQLWLYKLHSVYGYQWDEIIVEKPIQAGVEIGTKSADILVTRKDKVTPKIIIEVKKPNRKDGIGQLKSYLNVEGSPIGVWSNGSERIILYRPYPKEFDDTLTDIPNRDQEPNDLLEAVLTLDKLSSNFNFKKIIQDLEELVLADSGKDEFNEIFKLIFAKIWDEKEAEENQRDRPNKELKFKKSLDPETTYNTINQLFQNASSEWPGIFKEGERIELKSDHLSVCIGPMVNIRLMGSNMRIMDDAFEYLLPTEAKKKKGQFFTPRFVIDMCVKMLNPKSREYVIDPACGSAGFLLHAMEWCYPANNSDERLIRMSRYASKYLWGIDLEERAAKTSRALMLIAGDGHTKIFGPDVSGLNPKEWFDTRSGKSLMEELRKERLLKNMPAVDIDITDPSDAWSYFDELQFDIVLSNPPFAGEIKNKSLLEHFELAKPALSRARGGKVPKEERDVLFIERIIKMLKPGGRAAIILPQGKFNNSSLNFIRNWIQKEARILAVIGLHPNTFKPHTGTKTSALFIQKYTSSELEQIKRVEEEVETRCPDYEEIINALLKAHNEEDEIKDEVIPEEIAELIQEEFGQVEVDIELDDGETDTNESDDIQESLAIEDIIENAEEFLENLKIEYEEIEKERELINQQIQELREGFFAEIEKISKEWVGLKKDLNVHLKPIKAKHKEIESEFRASFQEARKQLTNRKNSVTKSILQAEINLKSLTNKGRLELIKNDSKLLEKLKERFIIGEVATILDYPIFMAVSEVGGKNNSGDYVYVLNADGSISKNQDGPIVDQDLVNYNISIDDLNEIDNINESELNVAEAFIKFAKEQKFSFWED
ncbi:N-6 DNA methylase [Ornithinibacillus salinisoli]|uniref:N-6 DNA methylase n=1 Tax=Ornithinibacillus salinisoli TaxID=1848459 RepID=A0ABW4W4G0_9BACI